MSMPPPNHLDDDAIEATAATWLAQRGEGFSPAEAAEFERWRRADSRHSAALARLEQTVALLEKMPLLHRKLPHARRLLESAPAPGATPFHLPVPSFRAVAGLAAVLALTGAGWWLWPGDSNRSYTTTADGYERAALPDGSVLELNAGSRVDVRFTPTERRIILTRGEAHFTVAKNPARPFIVTAGPVQVQAVGTAFNVRYAPNQVEVLVTEGQVAMATLPEQPHSENLARSDSAAMTTLPPSVAPVTFATQLTARQRIRIPTTVPIAVPEVETVSPAIIQASLVWQVPRLEFVDSPLAEVVAQFNRRNRVQLVIGDALLATRPVGGSFQADQVETFVRLLEDTGEIVIERIVTDRIILRTAPVPRRP